MALKTVSRRSVGVHVRGRGFIAVTSLSGRGVVCLLRVTRRFRGRPGERLLGKGIMTALFFRPSAHARLDFRATTGHLNTHIVNFSSTGASDAAGNRALGSAVLVIDGCTSIVTVHRFVRNTTRCTDRMTPIPVIGTNSNTRVRPSRYLLSLCSVFGARKALRGLGVCLINSLGCNHAIRSLVATVHRFGPAFRFVTPGRLTVPRRCGLCYGRRGVGCIRRRSFGRSIVTNTSVLCVAHMRGRHFDSLVRCRHIGGICVLGHSVLYGTGRGVGVVRPLPHIGRVTCSMSSSPRTCCVRRTRGNLCTHRTVFYRYLNVALRSIGGSGAVVR